MTGRISKTLLALFLLTVAAVPVSAAESPGWEFGVGLYAFLPTINGTLAYDIPGVGDQIEIDTGEILENLSFTMMGGFDVKRGSWGVFADMIYLKESKTESQQLPLERLDQVINLDASFELNSWIVNFGIDYQVSRSENGSTFWVLAGARYFNAETDLEIKADGPLETDLKFDSSSTIWNLVFGFEGRIALGKRWYIPYHLDLGTGDSYFTWQGLAGINYEWNWGGLALAYRYLDFDQGNSAAPLREMSMNGPEIGVYVSF